MFSHLEIDGADEGAKAMAGVLRGWQMVITPSEASSAAGVIETYRKILKTAEFECRFQSLERVTNHEKAGKRIDLVCINLSM
tara:strand:+ start:1154 stop:1399 length:246 start_codon:yes stop_codon:yes gene_type:complete